MGGIFNQDTTAKARWLRPSFGGRTPAATNQTVTAGRCYLSLIEVEKEATIDSITLINGGTVAGNAIVGIYREATVDTPQGATLIATSADTALSGISTAQAISLTSPVTLSPGRYYAAMHYSDGTHIALRQAGTVAQAPTDKYIGSYFSQTYGALPVTAPAVFIYVTIPHCNLRVVQP